MATTTIQVSEELAEELAERKKRGDSYESVIWRLIEVRDAGRSPSRATDHGGEGVPVACEHCGYEWEYGGESSRPTCPDCGYKTHR